MKELLTTTMGKIRSRGPCREGWLLLCKNTGNVGDNYNPDYEVTLSDIANSNGVEDAYWCVRALDWGNVAVRRAVISLLLKSVERYLKILKNPRLNSCLPILKDWCAGVDVDPIKVRLNLKSILSDRACLHKAIDILMAQNIVRLAGMAREPTLANSAFLVMIDLTFYKEKTEPELLRKDLEEACKL